MNRRGFVGTLLAALVPSWFKSKYPMSGRQRDYHGLEFEWHRVYYTEKGLKYVAEPYPGPDVADDRWIRIFYFTVDPCKVRYSWSKPLTFKV